MSDLIVVSINGEDQSVPACLTMVTLFETLGLEPRLVAVEYNGEILPRQEWPTTEIRSGDRLEVVTMVGGG